MYKTTQTNNLKGLGETYSSFVQQLLLILLVLHQFSMFFFYFLVVFLWRIFLLNFILDEEKTANIFCVTIHLSSASYSRGIFLFECFLAVWDGEWGIWSTFIHFIMMDIKKKKKNEWATRSTYTIQRICKFIYFFRGGTDDLLFWVKYLDSKDFPLVKMAFNKKKMVLNQTFICVYNNTWYICSYVLWIKMSPFFQNTRNYFYH